MSESVEKKWNIGRRPHVAVVGAGVAGLRCTDALLDAGIEVTIYEGRPHTGGRVHQTLQEQHFIDMGANWIHGTVGNPIMDIARRTGAQIASIGEELAFYSEYGCEMKDSDKDRAEELHEIVWSLISDAFKYSNKTREIPATESLKDFFIAELKKRDLCDEDKRILLQMAEEWGHFASLPFEKQSLKYFWMEECIEGENLFVSSSYRSILDYISRRALEEAHLLVGPSHTVTTVGTVSQSHPKRCFIRSRADTAEFDACVLTVPLGALKRNSIDFEPVEPMELRRAIEQLGYGCLEKAYITFPQAWWRSDAGPAPALMEFLHPQYDPHNTDRDIVDAMDLSLLPDDTAQPTLLFYFHGKFARQTVEAYVDSEGDMAAFVTERFKPYYRLLPNYDSSAPACIPSAATMTTWSADPMAGWGSYSNFPISCDEAQLDRCVERLRAAMPERGIYLAGEHTAPFVALGTVTGAYWSGEHVAERIIERFTADEVDDWRMDVEEKEQEEG